jgi:hypothetical protein
VNRRAAADVQGLARKLNSIADYIGDLEDLLRSKQREPEERADAPTAMPE